MFALSIILLQALVNTGLYFVSIQFMDCDISFLYTTRKTWERRFLHSEPLFVFYFCVVAYTHAKPWQELSKFTYRSTEGVSKVLSKMVTSNSLSVAGYLESIDDFKDIDTDTMMEEITSGHLKSKEFAVLLVCNYFPYLLFYLLC